MLKPTSFGCKYTAYYFYIAYTTSNTWTHNNQTRSELASKHNYYMTTCVVFMQDKLSRSGNDRRNTFIGAALHGNHAFSMQLSSQLSLQDKSMFSQTLFILTGQIIWKSMSLHFNTKSHIKKKKKHIFWREKTITIRKAMRIKVSEISVTG